MSIYVPRAVTPDTPWQVGSLRMKTYGIGLDSDTLPDPSLWNAAQDVAQIALPQISTREGGSEDLGFAILHVGEQGTWLLLHWWAHGDICCEALFRADPDTSAFVPVADRPLMACVWELHVIAHEQRSWIAHMMSENPDAASYLADTLVAGAY